MNCLVLTILTVFISFYSFAGNGNRSKNYEELIQAYQDLGERFPGTANLITAGKTDCGVPLHLFVISGTGIFDPDQLKKDQLILFINNGIHPGEPDGMDASFAFAEMMLINPAMNTLLKKIVICIVPVYNIDGALQRGCCSRANQDGPESYGFRGNAKNLDLNRDFIKMDALNTESLIELLRAWDPDVFVDTHVSNGADYQYTMTLISSQHDKMNSAMGAYMKNTLTPSLFTAMKKLKDEATPYVNTYHESEIPDSGITAFLETPRFSSGYQALFNCFSFISETHMLKPFPNRVQSTIHLLTVLATTSADRKDEIKAARKAATVIDAKLTYYPINYRLDTTRVDALNFKGFTAVYKLSPVTETQRLFYDRSKPFEKKIPLYDHYIAKDSIRIPSYYIVPQAWQAVITRLRKNHISMHQLESDTVVTTSDYFIDSFKTVSEPYEGHYLHHDVQTETILHQKKFQKGDYVIPVNGNNLRFLLEVLEPESVDSYFCWGFFDAVLQQKEWFSSYVFEDLAIEILKENDGLKKEFEEFKKNKTDSDEFTRLYFIYRRSKYFEKETFRMYPIGRVMETKP